MSTVRQRPIWYFPYLAIESSLPKSFRRDTFPAAAWLFAWCVFRRQCFPADETALIRCFAFHQATKKNHELRHQHTNKIRQIWNLVFRSLTRIRWWMLVACAIWPKSDPDHCFRNTLNETSEAPSKYFRYRFRLRTSGESIDKTVHCFDLVDWSWDHVTLAHSCVRDR